jgi:Holliday junction DNA helicase RuvA
MIGFLRGFVVGRELGDDTVTMDVSGVGYELTCSANTLDDISSLETSGSPEHGPAEIQLWVQTQMREDSLTLFGFSTQLEKRMFNSLLKVNGVGPKMAIKILSGARLEGLATMIEAGDVKALSNLPKVGKKTAEQLILALKGKLVIASEEPMKKKAPPQLVLPQSRFDGPRAAVLSALVNLGFRLPDAERVVSDLPEGIELESGVRKGLQALSGSF